MRPSLFGLLVLSLIVAGAYWYQQAEAVCNVPISYRIGAIDDRFNISESDVRIALVDAEAVWENATGRNLFTYDDTADLSVNFVFDERQLRTDIVREIDGLREESQETSAAISKRYNDLVAQHEALAADFEKANSAYAERLAAYNAKVQKYNDAGGAPQDVYEELEKERSALDDEQAALKKTVAQLNELGDDINALGTQGNQLINAYNDNVNRFNETFGEPDEFTQGDYTGEAIDIYAFADRNELVTTLAHEFGHALSIGHVANEHSIMYPQIGQQSTPPIVTDEDLAGFAGACNAAIARKDFVAKYLGWVPFLHRAAS